MNIFYLHHDPRLAAEMMHDKHVVKMILETAQILSTVCHRHGSWVEGMYRPTHQNHPSVLWAGDTATQFYWLVEHGQHLVNEFRYRYSKWHKSGSVIDLCAAEAPRFNSLAWAEPPQAMPDEFKIPGDAVAAYRAYYLGRKVEQSGWTRRPAPTFVVEGTANMAKTKQVRAAKPAATPAPADAPAAAQPAAEATAQRIGARGPKGVENSSRITLLVDSNPKRPGSKAHAVFALYEDGMTVQDFLDRAGKAATPNLVYDAAHGFIAVEGYQPVPVVRKARAAKPATTGEDAPAAAPKRGRPAKAAAAPAPTAAVEEEVQAETID